MKVGLAQIAPNSDDPVATLEGHLAALEQARAAGAELVVFPELSLSGYLVDEPRAWADEFLDASIEALRAAAGGATVLAGAPWPHAGGGATNAVVAISSEGVIARQDKIHLTNYGGYTEGRRFTPADRFAVASIAGRRVAILICADAWYPALGYAARHEGAELFIHPSASAVSGVSESFASDGAWTTINRAQALYHTRPVVFVNYAGGDRDTSFWGGSCVVAPTGTELAQLGDAPELRVVSIEDADTLAARELLRMSEDEDTRLSFATLSRVAEARSSEEAGQ